MTVRSSAASRLVFRAPARFDQFEVYLGRGIEQDEVVPSIAPERRKMVHFPPELLLQIMDDRARGADRGRHLGAAEAIERFDAEMLAQSEARMFRQKGEIIVGKRPLDLSELRVLAFADQQLRGRNPREIVHQRADIARLRDPKLTGAQLGIGEAKNAILKINGAEIIRPVGFEQVHLAHGAGRDDLRDLARDDLPRLRFARLVANRDAPPRLDELRDVTWRRVVRHPAHRHAIAMSQREIEQAGSLLGVVEKELVKIAEPKEQQGIRRHAGAQPLVLLHHGGKGVGHGFQLGIKGPFLRVCNSGSTTALNPEVTLHSKKERNMKVPGLPMKPGHKTK